MRISAVAPAALLLLSFGTGCIKSTLLNGQIKSTRAASKAVDTIGDLDIVEVGTRAGIVQFEGMHELAPDNVDALFMLTKAWTSYAFGFAEDHYEEAHDKGDEAAAEHWKKNANMAYDRAVGYGIELLTKSGGGDGFEAAKKNEASLKAWLNDKFDDAEDDAPNLFWAGYAWMARVSFNKDNPERVAELWIGVSFLQRALELDPSYNNYSGYIALGSYHARSAGAELDQAKKLFDEAIAKTAGNSLTAYFAYAARYACAKQDAALYEKMLTKVLETGETAPPFRLLNAVARKRAKRWLTEKRMFEQCSLDPTPNGPVAAQAKKK